ncbi:MAG: DUF1295 domain-containing protein [Bacteroidota bacterium]
MWRTVLLLITGLIIVPLLAFNFDTPMSELQAATLWKLVNIYLISAALCFIISSLTKNYSQVDKLWSTIPILYVWVAAAEGNFEPRLVLMAGLVSLWGIRLTLNFARRGGYSWKFWAGEEDYRWAVLRAKPEFQPEWKWVLFNLFFISLYQMGLVLLMTLPIIKSMEGGALGWIDYVLAALIVGMVIYETISDQQQWEYQEEKHRRIREGENLGEYYGKGFTHTGLWGISRHPNYFAEQGVWVLFYFFSVIASGNWINWTATGFFLLLVLFKSSSDFSEEISAEKYPEYKGYQQRVPRFVPFTKFSSKSTEEREKVAS